MTVMFATVIAIEGGDRQGKATQSKMLAHALQRYGARVKRVEVPFNDGFTHKLIYKMLRDGSAKEHVNLFQLVQSINKLIFQLTYMFWLWLTCDFVVLDRWTLSSLVYGSATGANPGLLRFFNSLLFEPKLTIVLDGPSFSRNNPDTYESDTELQATVKEMYRAFAEIRERNTALVSNQGTREDVHDRVVLEVTSRGVW